MTKDKTTAIAKIEFDEETVQLIKNTVAVGATDAELKLFLYQAKRSGLDPLTRQIYFIKMGGRAVMMSSIDGFRVIADRAGDYAGQDEPIFVNDPNTNELLVCKVKVYKWHKDEKYVAATGVAYMNEYRIPNSQSWVKMPHVMLSKVAEAKALRQAFPQDLSGIYAQEEMDQAGEELQPAARPIQSAPTAPSAPTVRMASEEQKRLIFALGKEAGKESETVKEIVKTHFKLVSFNDLTSQQASATIESLNKKIAAKAIKPAEPTEEVIDVDEVEAGIEKMKADEAKDPAWITGEDPADPTP
jgi:phage recombination protein Bet